MSINICPKVTRKNEEVLNKTSFHFIPNTNIDGDCFICLNMIYTMNITNNSCNHLISKINFKIYEIIETLKNKQ